MNGVFVRYHHLSFVNMKTALTMRAVNGHNIFAFWLAKKVQIYTRITVALRQRKAKTRP